MRLGLDFPSSNEVEALDGGAKVGVRDWDRGRLATFGAVTDQVGESMCVLDGCRYFD